MQINIPDKVNKIIEVLIANGYEAYAVGGCIRDALLGRKPKDWDITTSASPSQVKRLFRRTVDTGIKHGTVTVLTGNEQYEVTTYRLDGEYEDYRHPREVRYTSSLNEDLKRRDFTINAMAYNSRDGLVDLFGGMQDLASGLVRCVGSASERFNEDALRILRAVRFSAQLGFAIEQDTLEAIRQNAGLLVNISAERIRAELDSLLISDHPEKLKLLYDTGITKVILPEFDIMMQTGQNNIHHAYSVGEHTIIAVMNVAGTASQERFTQKERSILRWTMLLHDVEKPASKTIGKDGQDHFYGHQEKGAVKAGRILKRLKFDNETLDKVVHLIRWHDYRFSLSPEGMRRAASKIGREYMELIFEVNRADIYAKNPKLIEESINKLERARRLYEEICARGECVSLRELDINGRDLIAAGFKPGRELGRLLDRLLACVIKDPALNKKDILLELSRKLQ
jgi:tRNA nucleotidyltransferase (CCA-adding enzyme)